MNQMNDIRNAAKMRDNASGEKSYQDAILHLDMLITPKADETYLNTKSDLYDKYDGKLDIKKLREDARKDFIRQSGGDEPNMEYVNATIQSSIFNMFSQKVDELYIAILLLMERKGYLGKKTSQSLK